MEKKDEDHVPSNFGSKDNLNSQLEGNVDPPTEK